MSYAAVAFGFALMAGGFFLMSAARKADDPAAARKSRIGSALLFLAAIAIFVAFVVTFFSSHSQGAL